jgi:hypothetical protein
VWETLSPCVIPFRIPTQGSLQSYFVHMFYLAYIIIILLAHSKSATTKICRKKYIKNTRPCRTPRPVDPAKRGPKRTGIELAMLDFRPGAKRACQLTARIDGIDRAFLFGNARLPCSCQGCSLFPSRLGTIVVSWGLALIGTNYFIAYLGIDTAPESSGAGPVTPTPGGVGRKPPTVRRTGEYLSKYFRR